MIQSRRSFLTSAIALPFLVPDRFVWASPTNAGSVISPNGTIWFELVSGKNSAIKYQVRFMNHPILELSDVGFTVSTQAQRAAQQVVRKIAAYNKRESFPTRGLHSIGLNRCNGAFFEIAGETKYQLEVRAFDDGIAFRYLYEGDDAPRVPFEFTSFVLPNESVVWFHDFQGHYEGVHARKNISAVKAGEWAAPPLTVKLPADVGYAAITEAGLMNYANGFTSRWPTWIQAHSRRSVARKLPIRVALRSLRGKTSVTTRSNSRRDQDSMARSHDWKGS